MAKRESGTCPNLGEFNPNPAKGTWVCGYPQKSQEYCMIHEPAMWETKCPYYIAQADSPKKSKKGKAEEGSDRSMKSRTTETLVEGAKRSAFMGLSSWIVGHAGVGYKRDGTPAFYFFSPDDFQALLEILNPEKKEDEED